MLTGTRVVAGVWQRLNGFVTLRCSRVHRWDRVLQSDQPIDLSAVHAGEDVRSYPEHARRKAAKALWDSSQRNSETVADKQSNPAGDDDHHCTTSSLGSEPSRASTASCFDRSSLQQVPECLDYA